MDQFNAAERPITCHEVCELRLLLFGKINDSFGREWLKQGLKFQNQKPTYKLIQMRGGPCGIISAVQAFIILDFLFSENRITEMEEAELDPNPGQKKQALVRAMVSILMQVSKYGKTIMVWKGPEIILNDEVLPDDLRRDNNMEYLIVRTFTNKDELENFLHNFVDHYMNDQNGGVATFLYSVILTKGIKNIRNEMDQKDTILVGENGGYCTQELVNLLLVGMAVTNVFDGNVRMQDGDDVTICKGIPRRSKIGFMSLFEYTGDLSVGSRYKYPTYPIWVANTQNHYTTIFGRSMDVLSDDLEEPFILTHVDGMCRRRYETFINVQPMAPINIQNVSPSSSEGGSSNNSCGSSSSSGYVCSYNNSYGNDDGYDSDGRISYSYTKGSKKSKSKSSKSSKKSSGKSRKYSDGKSSKNYRNRNCGTYNLVISSSSSSSDDGGPDDIEKCVLSRWPHASVESYLE